MLNKYDYSGFGIGFDTRSSFSLTNGNGFGKNVIVFSIDSSPGHAGIKQKYIY